MNILNVLAKTHLKYDQNAADDAGVSVNHGLLHDVTYEAEVGRPPWAVFLWRFPGADYCWPPAGWADGCTWHQMMEQLVYHFGCAYHFFCHKETKYMGKMIQIISAQNISTFKKQKLCIASGLSAKMHSLLWKRSALNCIECALVVYLKS